MKIILLLQSSAILRLVVSILIQVLIIVEILAGFGIVGLEVDCEWFSFVMGLP